MAFCHFQSIWLCGYLRPPKRVLFTLLRMQRGGRSGSRIEAEHSIRSQWILPTQRGHRNNNNLSEWHSCDRPAKFDIWCLSFNLWDLLDTYTPLHSRKHARWFPTDSFGLTGGCLCDQNLGRIIHMALSDIQLLTQTFRQVIPALKTGLGLLRLHQF